MCQKLKKSCCSYKKDVANEKKKFLIWAKSLSYIYVTVGVKGGEYVFEEIWYNICEAKKSQNFYHNQDMNNMELWGIFTI